MTVGRRGRWLIVHRRNVVHVILQVVRASQNCLKVLTSDNSDRKIVVVLAAHRAPAALSLAFVGGPNSRGVSSFCHCMTISDHVSGTGGNPGKRFTNNNIFVADGLRQGSKEVSFPILTGKVDVITSTTTVTR